MPLNPAATNVDDDAIDTLAREVAAYLATHPDAADTVDGISRWWLTRMRVEKATADVQRALEVLVAQRVVVERRLPDGRVVYSAAP